MKPYFAALIGIFIVLTVGLVGQCTSREEQEKAEKEAALSVLTEAETHEIMSRQRVSRIEQDYKIMKERQK